MARAISKAGRLAGTSIRLGPKEDQLDYRLENDPRFLQRIEQARASLRAVSESVWKTSNKRHGQVTLRNHGTSKNER
jgi:hypothetical protein